MIEVNLHEKIAKEISLGITRAVMAAGGEPADVMTIIESVAATCIMATVPPEHHETGVAMFASHLAERIAFRSLAGRVQ